jgi:hypothetical protein
LSNHVVLARAIVQIFRNRFRGIIKVPPGITSRDVAAVQGLEKGAGLGPERPEDEDGRYLLAPDAETGTDPVFADK